MKKGGERVGATKAARKVRENKWREREKLLGGRAER